LNADEKEMTMSHLTTLARAAAFAGLVSGCVALSAPAFAQDADALPQGALVIRGVDFTSPKAVAHLKRRLDHLAMNICTPQSSGHTFLSHDEQACYDTALKNGLAQIDSHQEQAMRDQAQKLAVANPGN
jgi:UrcA family protein